MKEINSQSLQGATLNLENALTNFFREKSGFPKFKSKKNPVQYFPIPQWYKVDFENKWECPSCKIEHDRDIKASVNLKNFALDRQNLIGIKSPSV